MELGLNFDDGDFAEEKKQKPILMSYNAKICKPKWFLNPALPDATDDMATVLKFQADYQYRIGEYVQAVATYQESLEHIGSQNRIMRREIAESLARCYIHIGALVKAKEYSNKMLEDCLTSAHFCQALLLQHQIHKTAGNLHDEIHILHQLIQLHSFYHPFWTMLAQAYSKLPIHKSSTTKKDELTGICVYSGSSEHQVNIQPHGDRLNKLGPIQTEIEQIEKSIVHKSIPVKGGFKTIPKEETIETDTASSEPGSTSSQSDNRELEKIPEMNGIPQRKTAEKDIEEKVEISHNNVDCDEILSGHPLDLVKFTCYVRAKLILQSEHRHTGSLVNKKNTEILEKVEEDIEALAKDEHTLQAVTEFMRKDMFDDEIDENKSKENEEPQNVVESPIPIEDFNKRWFSWIHQL